MLSCGVGFSFYSQHTAGREHTSFIGKEQWRKGDISASDFAPQEIRKQQSPHSFFFRGGTELAEISPSPHCVKPVEIDMSLPASPWPYKNLPPQITICEKTPKITNQFMKIYENK
ncbi:MAG: hypothetical protein IJI25_09690 [Eubacterium sp.]|nr:hypothetical protein [Eubacterium sp.]